MDDIIGPLTQDSIQVDEKPVGYCPICGSEEYKEVRKSNGILGPGGYSVLQYCLCKGCNIMFKDPNVFFKRTIQ